QWRVERMTFIRSWLEELLEVVVVCFFFQAEDGIRDLYVTGVQTCALPILTLNDRAVAVGFVAAGLLAAGGLWGARKLFHTDTARSEERRVGKECRSRWSPDQ